MADDVILWERSDKLGESPIFDKQEEADKNNTEEIISNKIHKNI